MMLICIRFSKLFYIYAPKNRKKSVYFLNTYEEIAPNSNHTLSDDTMASISQILGSIIQLQLTIIYFKLRRRDGLKQRNFHIKVRRNHSNDSKIEGGHTNARARTHTAWLSYRSQLNCFILGLNVSDTINISVPELLLLKEKHGLRGRYFDIRCKSEI